MINQTNANVDMQSITTPLIQLGEQLTLALVREIFIQHSPIIFFFFQKLLNQNLKNTDTEDLSSRGNSGSYTASVSGMSRDMRFNLNDNRCLF